MGKIQLLEEHKLRQFRWVGPRYYAHPDGEDLGGKLLFTTTSAGLVGLITGAYAASRAEFTEKPISTKIFKTVQHVVPCVGAAFLFTTVTFFSTRFRKKDDEINYVLGGLASGSVVGMVTASVPFGITAAITLAAVGYYQKYTHTRGYKFSGIMRKTFPPYFQRRLNSTNGLERLPGNWYKYPEEKNQ